MDPNKKYYKHTEAATILEFQDKPSQDGETKVKFSITKPEKKSQNTEECTVWMSSLESIEEKSLFNLRQEEKSAMLEYLLEIKKMTLKDNAPTSKINILITRLLQTLEADLTSKGKDLKPFWSTRTALKSKSLWLPTKTGCVALDSNLLNT